MKSIALVIAIAFALVGCGGGSDAIDEPVAIECQTVKMATLQDPPCSIPAGGIK